MDTAEQQVPVDVTEKEETNSVIDELKRRDTFKVYVSNVGNFMSQKEVIRLFTEHNVKGVKYSMELVDECRSVRKQKGKTFAFVTFDTIENRNEGIKVIETIQVEKHNLVCKDVLLSSSINNRPICRRSVHPSEKQTNKRVMVSRIRRQRKRRLSVSF